MASFLRLLPLVLLLPLAAQAAALRLSLTDLVAPAFSARDVVLELSEGDGPVRLDLGSLTVGQTVYGKVQLTCPRARYVFPRLDCASGRLEAKGRPTLPVSFRMDVGRGEFELNLSPGGQEHWRLAGNWLRRETRVELESARLDHLAPWIPPLDAWQAKGEVSGSVQLTPHELGVRLEIAGGGFGNSAGTLAADRLAARLDLDAEVGRDGVWNWKILADWRSGEAYFAPVYLPSGGLKLAASGRYSAGQWSVSPSRLDMAGVGGLAFSGKVGADDTLGELAFSAQGLDLAKAGELFLAPWLEQAGLPKFRLGGKLDVSGNWRQGGLSQLDLVLKGGMLEEPEERFALSGLELRLPWRREEATRGEIRFAGARFQKLPLGAAILPIGMNGLDFTLARAEIPVLDGALSLEDGHAFRKGGHWQWQMTAALYPVSMEKLTRAVGLPPMAGRLSANIPRIHSEGGDIAMDGMLVIQVFDGFLAVNGLSLSAPFGRAPVLRAANVDIRHLDLGQLTHTFSFGEITGYLDGDIDGLELVHWQPQRFDARLASSPGDYPRRISQRAVQNISSLGGAGAGAAIQRSFLSFLETFGYQRIGLSCRLRNGVCAMGGVTASPRGYVLVEGGGIPALTVIGYNPTVDWEELVSRVRDAVAHNVRPIVR